MPWFRLLPLCLVALAAGCGPPLPEGAKPTRPITATVTYKGAPVVGGTVTFMSQGADQVAAYGTTDAQGKAKMKTYTDDDGAVLAKHKVIISKVALPPAGNVAATESAEYVPPGPSGTPLPTIQNQLPAKYASPTTTDLTVEVTDSSPSEVAFDLKD